MSLSEVVVGATRRKLRLTFVDENGAPVNVSGGSARLQGTSADLPSNTIDQAGTIVDGPNGVFEWSQLGGTAYVSDSDLGGLSEATYTLRVKFTDAASQVDFGDEFVLTWKKAPAV